MNTFENIFMEFFYQPAEKKKAIAKILAVSLDERIYLRGLREQHEARYFAPAWGCGKRLAKTAHKF